MNIKTYKNIYLVGIGGIGMSALANYFYSQNKNVYGYDRVKSTLTGSSTRNCMLKRALQR